MDMFSKSLDLEYKQHGISVHNQVLHSATVVFTSSCLRALQSVSARMCHMLPRNPP